MFVNDDIQQYSDANLVDSDDYGRVINVPLLLNSQLNDDDARNAQGGEERRGREEKSGSVVDASRMSKQRFL